MTSIELRTSILIEIASIMDNEELKEEIELSEDDDRHNRYYTTEQLRKKHPLCNK